MVLYSQCCNVPTEPAGNHSWLICPKCNQRSVGLKKPRLPTINEMSGLVHDFTNGKLLKEYMEELSDESST
jgi:hypothetical protein